MNLEGQTEFRDIPWTRQRPAGVFRDSAQSMPHRVGVATKSPRPRHRPVIVLPRPKRFEKHLPVLVGKVTKPSNAAPTVWIIASGALTAAVARMEPSNIATEEVESARPRNIIRATCRARGVSRRSPKAALTPARPSATTTTNVG